MDSSRNRRIHQIDCILPCISWRQQFQGGDLQQGHIRTEQKVPFPMGAKDKQILLIKVGKCTFSQHLIAIYHLLTCILLESKIKSEHTLISQIRGASGFHYDDVKGAMIDNATRTALDGFCKVHRVPNWKLFLFQPNRIFQSHPGAAKYENNLWPYWDDVSPLMSVIPKRTHLHHPAGPSQSENETDLLQTRLLSPISRRVASL